MVTAVTPQWMLALIGALGVCAHATLLVTRKLPSKHNVYHAWFWGGGLLFFLHFAPRLALPTPTYVHLHLPACTRPAAAAAHPPPLNAPPSSQGA